MAMLLSLMSLALLSLYYDWGRIGCEYGYAVEIE